MKPLLRITLAFVILSLISKTDVLAQYYNYGHHHFTILTEEQKNWIKQRRESAVGYQEGGHTFVGYSSTMRFTNHFGVQTGLGFFGFSFGMKYYFNRHWESGFLHLVYNFGLYHPLVEKPTTGLDSPGLDFFFFDVQSLGLNYGFRLANLSNRCGINVQLGIAHTLPPDPMLLDPEDIPNPNGQLTANFGLAIVFVNRRFRY